MFTPMGSLNDFRMAAPPVALEAFVRCSVLDSYAGFDLLVHLRDPQGQDWLQQCVGEQWNDPTYTRRDLYYQITPADLARLTCNRLPLRTAIRNAPQSFVCDTVFLVTEGQVARKTQTRFYRFVEVDFPKNGLPREGVLLSFDATGDQAGQDANSHPG